MKVRDRHGEDIALDIEADLIYAFSEGFVEIVSMTYLDETRFEREVRKAGRQ